MVGVPGYRSALDGAECDPDAVWAGDDGADGGEAVLAVRPEALRVQRVRRRLLVQQRRAHRHVLNKEKRGNGCWQLFHVRPPRPLEVS